MYSTVVHTKNIREPKSRYTLETALWGDLRLSRVAAISFDSLWCWETFAREMATQQHMLLFYFFDNKKVYYNYVVPNHV